MIELKQPVSTVLYDYRALEHYISVWRNVEAGAPWVGTGYESCSPVHKRATSSRQWDSTSSVLDDELEKNTAVLMGQCVENLSQVDQALVMYGQCQVRSTWVEDMDPRRAQLRYEEALLKLALAARRNGIDV